MKTLTAAELADIKARALAMHGEPVLDLEFTDAELDCDIQVMPMLPALPVEPAMPGTRLARPLSKGRIKMSIRLPNAVVNAFKEKAQENGTGYQTLISKTLKEASAGW